MWHFIFFGTIEPILIILKIEYRLSGCSLTNYVSAYKKLNKTESFTRARVCVYVCVFVLFLYVRSLFPRAAFEIFIGYFHFSHLSYAQDEL